MDKRDALEIEEDPTVPRSPTSQDLVRYPERNTPARSEEVFFPGADVGLQRGNHVPTDRVNTALENSSAVDAILKLNRRVTKDSISCEKNVANISGVVNCRQIFENLLGSRTNTRFSEVLSDGGRITLNRGVTDGYFMIIFFRDNGKIIDLKVDFDDNGDFTKAELKKGGIKPDYDFEKMVRLLNNIFAGFRQKKPLTNVLARIKDLILI